uniref:Lanthionine synthetase c-like protein 1 n=2 Tax=Rhodnius prolixus TaxID=13249 RepID=T1IB17_RHOPR
MDPRHITNNYSDFIENEPSDYLEDKQIKSQLIASSNRLINSLLMKINKSVYEFDKNSDYSIYTGYSGIAFLHYFNYIKRDNIESYDIAKYLTDKALTNLKGRDISFLLGDAGPLALGALIYTKENNSEEVENLISRLLKLPERVSNYPDELLYGRAGYIFALLFLRKHLGNVIPEDYLKKQLNHLIISGTRTAKTANSMCPLKYLWHGENYLGAAHGIAGILYILLLNKDLLTEQILQTLIKPTLDWLISKRYAGGNFPSSDGSRHDKLVQWCHGAPGFVNLFTLASEIYRSDKYMKVALECGEVVWNRGILMKGYSICHGVSGNAYTFAHLYQKTNQQLHLHRLACFLNWCNTYPNNEGMRPDRPLSMFEGISGVTYFLIDVQDLLTAAFPAYALN